MFPYNQDHDGEGCRWPDEQFSAEPANASTTLKVCVLCGSHAVFIWPDGSKSQLFITKHEGLEELAEAVAVGRIDKIEAAILLDDLFDCSLPTGQMSEYMLDHLGRPAAPLPPKLPTDPREIQAPWN